MACGCPLFLVAFPPPRLHSSRQAGERTERDDDGRQRQTEPQDVVPFLVGGSARKVTAYLEETGAVVPMRCSKSTPRTSSLHSFQTPPSWWNSTMRSLVLFTKMLPGGPSTLIFARATANSSS